MTKYLLFILLFSSFTFGQQSSMKVMPNKIEPNKIVIDENNFLYIRSMSTNESQ